MSTFEAATVRPQLDESPDAEPETLEVMLLRVRFDALMADTGPATAGPASATWRPTRGAVDPAQ